QEAHRRGALVFGASPRSWLSARNVHPRRTHRTNQTLGPLPTLSDANQTMILGEPHGTRAVAMRAQQPLRCPVPHSKAAIDSSSSGPKLRRPFVTTVTAGIP